MITEFLVCRKYPSYPAKADKILSRHTDSSAAYAEAVKLSQRLRGGAVSVMRAVGLRITGYDMLVGGKVVRYGRETEERTDAGLRVWHHVDLVDHPFKAMLNGPAR